MPTEGSSKKRVVCFVDGFNLYHALVDLRKNHLKWLDLRSLANAFIKPSEEILAEVYFFTAYPTWRPESLIRHKSYIKALRTRKVDIIEGRFKTKQKKCNSCKEKWIVHEEKRTDVNIAIHLLHLAYADAFDKAFLVTADSDLCPAIDLVLQQFKNKQIHILIPPGRYSIARELRSVDRVLINKIKEKHVSISRLPETFCPKEYKLPTNIIPEIQKQTVDEVLT